MRRRRLRYAPDHQLSLGLGLDGSKPTLTLEPSTIPKSEPSRVPAVAASVRPKQARTGRRRKGATPIESPLDCLNALERAEYEALCSAPISLRAELASQSSGLVQIGYSELCTTTSRPKRSVQRAVSRLIKKGFLEIYAPANSHVGDSTVYRVPNLDEIGATMQAAGLTHWVQIGSGRKAIRIAAFDSSCAPLGRIRSID
jgi:hypothetical protein